MKSTITCPIATITETLRFLQASGKNHCEGIALWLGTRERNTIHVQTVYEPAHRAEADFFHIPRQSMFQLKEYLRQNRLFIAAQVHSHPFEAFHSDADNRWAIIRHTGALSIVIPNFAANTTPTTFLNDAAIYQLSQDNKWERVPQRTVEKLCKITP
ncbi:MAG: Mov34/MPN/PAD-1 family protein [Pseudomonadota bacterium]